MATKRSFSDEALDPRKQAWRLSGVQIPEVCDIQLRPANSGAQVQHLFRDRTSRLAALPPDIQKAYFLRRYLNPWMLGQTEEDCDPAIKEVAGNQLLVDPKYSMSKHTWRVDCILLQDGLEVTLSVGVAFCSRTQTISLVLFCDQQELFVTILPNVLSDFQPIDQDDVITRLDGFVVQFDRAHPCNTIVAVVVRSCSYPALSCRIRDYCSTSVLFLSGDGRRLHTVGPFRGPDESGCLPYGNSFLIYYKRASSLPVLVHSDGNFEPFGSVPISYLQLIRPGNYARLDPSSQRIDYGTNVLGKVPIQTCHGPQPLWGIVSDSMTYTIEIGSCTDPEAYMLRLAWTRGTNQEIYTIELPKYETYCTQNVIGLRDSGFALIGLKCMVPHIRRYQFVRPKPCGE